MKALILAGGKGTRLRPITYSMAKQLVPVANKPVVEYGLEALIRAGVKEIGVIVGDTADAVMAALGDGSRWGAEITYIPQPDPLGLAHAVATAKPFLGSSDFVMYLGDNLVKSSLEALIEEFQFHRPSATILLSPVKNPSQFGVAEMDGDCVRRLEEKPAEPRSNLALVGVYIFSSAIHDIIAKLQPSARGEYEITEAIQGLIDQGQVVRSHVVQDWWKDTGTVEAMLEANRLILEDLETKIEGEVDSESRIEGRVSIARGARIVKSVVRGPAIIGSDCLIENSFVGPFTAIDAGTTLRSSEIENSIVLAECHIENAHNRIESSLIGRGAVVRQSDRVPKTLSLVLGDSSQVEIP
ncbi:MAG: glucose-1-phosphate thymidylyltransferase [Armatimonadetes bacterium]|nr:glucose-1-phosphate thymidylyltransferase [Armatimonadota bacterium]